MSNVGGSANINGILFQILGTLDKAVSVAIENAKTKDDDIVQARLVIEPAGGGDLLIDEPSGRIVQQWKAKAKGGTWSLKNVVDYVLPDLYLAVPNGDLDPHCTYAFITEGRRSTWNDAYDLFHALPSDPTAEQFIDALPDTPKRHTLGTIKVSDRGLFNYILTALRKRDDVKNENQHVTQEKARHLLQRFVMDEPIHREQIITRVNQSLRHHVEFAEDVDAKRCELCGVLLEVAAEGNRTLTAEWLLRKANIPLHSFRGWERLKKRIGNRLQSQLEKEQYDSTLDVRASVSVDDRVTIVTGESGQGKTWQLARIARDMGNAGALVAWVPSSRLTANAAEYAAQEIWNYGLERDAQLTLDRIASRREFSQPDIKCPWAYVCVDDVRSLDEAQSLRNLDWHRWGMALAISTSPDIARSLALSEGCCIVRANDLGVTRTSLRRRFTI